MNSSSESVPSGRDIIQQFLATSPYVRHLGMQCTLLEPGIATLLLPFQESLVTVGTTVHGGAIASLIDTAAAVAAFSEGELPANGRGTTVSLTVNYLAAAKREDVQAVARVLRRGRSLVFLDIEVTGSSGEVVAKGLVTYKVG